MQLSGKDLQFFDEGSKKKYTPLLIESSAGMDRTTLTFLIDAYEKERSVDPNGKETERVVLHFHPRIAPVQVAVFSLARNKPELVEKARSIEQALRANFRTQYDEGNIGQLYRRQDEIGTPFCLTVDYDTLNDRAVTVRERDSMRQDRIAIDALQAYLRDHIA
jgi:glycyl-tRNA synthetase